MRAKAFCCFNSNAPDFARIGSLIMNYGKWNGQQVVDSAYVVEMTSLAKLKNPKTETIITNYGFQWWLAPNYKGHDIVYMRGKQGQYVAIIRDLNLVVCRLGHQQSKLFVGEDHRADFFKFIDIALDMTK